MEYKQINIKFENLKSILCSATILFKEVMQLSYKTSSAKILSTYLYLILHKLEAA